VADVYRVFYVSLSVYVLTILKEKIIVIIIIIINSLQSLSNVCNILLMSTGVAGVGEVCESDDDCTTNDSFCDDGICVCNDGFVSSVSGMACLGMIVYQYMQ